MAPAKKRSEKLSIGDLVGALNKRAPFDYAETWDNVGFLAGDAAEQLTGIVIAVNLGPEALESAKQHGANVIVCHHPPIFKPVSKLTRASAPYLFEALRNGISVIALHTNFDLASEELSRGLAAKLGFSFSGFLTQRGNGEIPPSIRQGKFITYVPEQDLDRVREAVCKAGAGVIGNYSQCSFSWEGEGTFLGGKDSHPALGQAGRLERAKERRLEVVFPWRNLEKVLEAARSAHSYEEMAYDVLELGNASAQIGYGFIASAESPTNFTFHKVLDSVKQTFQLNSAVVAGPGLLEPGMKVRRLAFSPGSGSSFVGAASAKGADVYVCGEVGYHQMLEARQKGLTLVLLGHSYSERFFVETVSSWCAAFGAAHKVFEKVHDAV